MLRIGWSVVSEMLSFYSELGDGEVWCEIQEHWDRGMWYSKREWQCFSGGAVVMLRGYITKTGCW